MKWPTTPDAAQRSIENADIAPRLAAFHLRDRFVDLLETVSTRHELIQLETAGPVEIEITRDVHCGNRRAVVISDDPALRDQYRVQPGDGAAAQYFGSQGLYCFDFLGNLKWKRDFGDMTTRNSFGEGSSPAIQGTTLVVNWDHEGDSFIVALDTRSGEEIWRRERDEPTSWSTPLIVEFDEKHQEIVSASRKTRSYDLETGDLIWECSGTALQPTE